ncbi:uncharacterized protein GGS22DRAFT_160204 [Annulohypoxylon maeteangense]|uniref:uncharacterized protein n=1 Tax=Annulohypoxylon maeteangense TaxID=1927788 RepID=UPI002007CD7A|nr:uncharacterized protein GGS22DRAFT_160204 [Annulohypoxylon maeteangense]KAI0886188.1 hypothetical protein GGS22DRAFT_160204 [Annulohypoxylon maeteangense]
MADSHRGHGHSRSSSNRTRQSARPRSQRHRRITEPSSTPSIVGDEVVGYQISLEESSNTNAAYLQGNTDMEETVTYQNIHPTSTTTTDLSRSVYTTSIFRPSTAPHGGDDANVTSYDPHISNYDSYPPDISPDYHQLDPSYSMTAAMNTSSRWLYSTYLSSNGHTTNTTTSDDVTAYTQPVPYPQRDTRFNIFSISPISSPGEMEVIDEDNTRQETDGVFSQDQGPHTQALSDPYDTSLGRRWSTENHHGSIEDTTEQVIPDNIGRQAEEEEQNHSIDERLGEDNIRHYMVRIEPWSPVNRHNESHYTSHSYLRRDSSDHVDDEDETN